MRGPDDEKFCQLKISSSHQFHEVLINRFEFSGNVKHIEFYNDSGYLMTKRLASNTSSSYSLEESVEVRGAFVVMKFITTEDGKLDISKFDIEYQSQPVLPMNYGYQLISSTELLKTSSNGNSQLQDDLGKLENRLVERFTLELNKVKYEIDQALNSLSKRIEVIESKQETNPS